MKFWQKRRVSKPVDEPATSEDPFDPAIHKDKQDILQAFHVSQRTLARWRDEDGLRMKYHNRKYFYNINDAERLFKDLGKHKKKSPIDWPYASLWTVVGLLELVFLITSDPDTPFSTMVKMAIPLLIAIPAQVIIYIKKNKKKKKK